MSPWSLVIGSSLIAHSQSRNPLLYHLSYSRVFRRISDELLELAALRVELLSGAVPIRRNLAEIGRGAIVTLMAGRIALTFGNFDGVHLGHQALVRAARDAVGKDGEVVAVTFEPHPTTILRRQNPPDIITPIDMRTRYLCEAGADRVVTIEPTIEFLKKSPEEFIAWIVNKHHPEVFVEGPDFRFGRGRSGSIETLKQCESKHEYETVVVDPVETVLTDQSVVCASSSLTRWLLGRGRVRDAANTLGRHYEIQGVVVEGERRGRMLGIPTANLDHGKFMLPADGVYSGSAMMENGTPYSAAISVGTKPMFGQHPRVCEVHLIGYDGSTDHYGWNVTVRFEDWIRDQIVFSNVESLTEQIHRDIEIASTHVQAREVVPLK